MLGLAAIATVAFIAIALRVIEGNADAFDRRWSLAIHSIDFEMLDVVMIGFTEIGSGLCLYGSIALVSLLAWRRRLWPFAVIMVANAVLSLVVNVTLKHWFVRYRPTLFDEITRPTTWSFPSGHAMSAIMVFGSIATVLIALYPRRRWRIVTAATIVSTGIGLSRIYLGVHWPLDVLAGYASGVPFLAVTVHLVHQLTHRQKPVP